MSIATVSDVLCDIVGAAGEAVVEAERFQASPMLESRRKTTDGIAVVCVFRQEGGSLPQSSSGKGVVGSKVARVAAFSTTGGVETGMRPASEPALSVQPLVASDAVDAQQIIAAQDQVMRQQDEHLDSISRSLGTVKNLGLQIRDELDMQVGRWALRRGPPAQRIVACDVFSLFA